MLACGLDSCGKENSRPAQEIEEETAAAVSLGRQQAIELTFGVITDTIEIEKRLLDVRVREAKLRRAGEDKLADTYVGAFIATLDSVNPPLRVMLQ